MEFLAFLYTVLLVAICLMMALLLYRSAKPAANRDDAEWKEWLRQQLEAQNRQMDAKLAEMAQQNLAAMGHISETLQASVQSMSTALAAGRHPAADHGAAPAGAGSSTPASWKRCAAPLPRA